MPDVRHPAPLAGGVVAAHLGWRLTPEGLRVLTTQVDGGVSVHVNLPQDIPRALDHVESLQGIRDRAFGVAHAALVKASPGLVWPEGLRKEVATLSQWRSPNRLARLAFRWREHRFEGDGEAYAALEAWRYHDHHLCLWESSEYEKTLRRRKDMYRQIAACMAGIFATLVVDTTDYREIALRRNSEEKAENETARKNRGRAAAGLFRELLIQAFRSRGREVVKVKAADLTHACRECGTIDTFDAAEQIHHTCSGCGETWDQDVNAARGMIERWREGQKGGGAREAECTKNVESRWDRAKRLRGEKEARQGTSRNVVDRDAE